MDNFHKLIYEKKPHCFNNILYFYTFIPLKNSKNNFTEHTGIGNKAEGFFCACAFYFVLRRNKHTVHYRTGVEFYYNSVDAGRGERGERGGREAGQCVRSSLLPLSENSFLP